MNLRKLNSIRQFEYFVPTSVCSMRLAGDRYTYPPRL
jgi:hypothetical protein